MSHRMICGLFASFCAILFAGAVSAAERVVDLLTVAPVWAGHPVGFSLLTSGASQYVAFYDTNRQMTLASRVIHQRTWKFQTLPSTVGWDSHNNVTMALDADGYLHVSGNMHVNPLVYFRSRRAHDISSLEPQPRMVGERESHVTYPRFLRTPAGELAFMYRDGRSGGGDTILNIYDRRERRWRRGIDLPLFGGGGQMNAYPVGPVSGPDGFLHIVWVWRDTPDCASNHDISYARSRDMVRWENSVGKPIPLPITIRTGEIVDPVPPGGGLINGNSRIGFDASGRPIISYHKHDTNGFTQIFCARLENGAWRSYQITDWRYRWDFNGGGSINFEIRVGEAQVNDDGQLTLSYSHVKHGSGVWQLDPATLKPVGRIRQENPLADVTQKFAGLFPGLQSQSARDLGKSDEPGVRFMLIWQTLSANRDRPRTGPLPPASTLRLVKLGLAP